MKAQVKKFHRSGSADDPANFTLVDVKCGDAVCFKSDIEQSGTVVEIRRSRSLGGGYEFVLESKYGFRGEYIGGSKRTVEHADDCWV